jgi:hypothetical protein
VNECHQLMDFQLPLSGFSHWLVKFRRVEAWHPRIEIFIWILYRRVASIHNESAAIKPHLHCSFAKHNHKQTLLPCADGGDLPMCPRVLIPCTGLVLKGSRGAQIYVP